MEFGSKESAILFSIELTLDKDWTWTWGWQFSDETWKSWTLGQTNPWPGAWQIWTILNLLDEINSQFCGSSAKTYFYFLCLHLVYPKLCWIMIGGVVINHVSLVLTWPGLVLSVYHILDTALLHISQKTNYAAVNLKFICQFWAESGHMCW